MLAKCVVLLGATNSRKLKMTSDKAVNFPLANMERTFHVHMLEESLSIIVQKYVSQQCFSLSLGRNLLLIFPLTSGSCSYKIIFVKKSAIISLSF